MYLHSLKTKTRILCGNIFYWTFYAEVGKMAPLKKKHKKYLKYKIVIFFVSLYELRIYPLNKGLITTLTTTQSKNYLFYVYLHFIYNNICFK